MTTLNAAHALQAWQAQEAAARRCTLADGLPHAVHEGAALSAYAWQGGELTEITEPDGTRWAYRYGDDGRLLAVLRNGEPFAQYRYDAAGRLKLAERPDGRLEHDHDDLGRLVRTRRGDASAWGYRWAGSGPAARVAEAFCDAESSQFHHDAQGRLTWVRQVVDGVALTLRNRFDQHGRLAEQSIAEWPHALGFTWDARGRPAAVSWNGRTVARFGCDDAQRLAWHEGQGGVVSRSWHEAGSGRALRQAIAGPDGTVLWQADLERDAAFRLVREGERRHAYDAQGRLVASDDAAQHWRYAHDGGPGVREAADRHRVALDAAGRVYVVSGPDSERVCRHNGAGELESLVANGETVAQCRYDHKGRLVWLRSRQPDGSDGVERFVYGADDGLLAVADGQGRPVWLVLRLPTGVVGLVDFRRDPAGEVLSLFTDHGGNAVLASDESGPLGAPLAYCPYGLPLGDAADPRVPPMFRGRFWHAGLGLYRIGARWYCPRLKAFLTPDTHTGAPDDARLVNPFVPAAEQRLARARVLGDWLRQPRLRQRRTYCADDPVNRFDPDGHWSFGGVLLSLLGVLWTLPNTAFGLAVEITCLIGEVVRWLVYACTLGHVSWQTPGFDVAASGRLDAFALVFKGGWLGSFDSLLGITFGNVIFVNGEYEQHPAFQALPDPVSPPAYAGQTPPVTAPKAQALYEHEMRHTNQYGWFGPFFHLGLPLFGVYEWDVILNGYQDAALERDARDHSGF